MPARGLRVARLVASRVASYSFELSAMKKAKASRSATMIYCTLMPPTVRHVRWRAWWRSARAPAEADVLSTCSYPVTLTL